MGKSTISIAIFNSKLLVYQRVIHSSMIIFPLQVATLGLVRKLRNPAVPHTPRAQFEIFITPQLRYPLVNVYITMENHHF